MSSQSRKKRSTQKQSNFAAREKENGQTKHSHTAKQTKKFSGVKANLETTMALRWSTNVNFKNLSETMGFRGRQDHYDAYVEDFSIFQMADGSKVVEFKENPTKTRQSGLRNPTRRSPQQMWSTDGGERDPVKLFEEWLEHRPDVLKKSGPLYLTIIPRPTSNTWYSKTRMGQHRIDHFRYIKIQLDNEA